MKSKKRGKVETSNHNQYINRKPGNKNGVPVQPLQQTKQSLKILSHDSNINPPKGAKGYIPQSSTYSNNFNSFKLSSVLSFPLFDRQLFLLLSVES